MEKGQSVDYVIVPQDVQPVHYYSGFFLGGSIVFTDKYTEAVKIKYRDEAEKLCDKLMELHPELKLVVEDHEYFQTPPEEDGRNNS